MYVCEYVCMYVNMYVCEYVCMYILFVSFPFSGSPFKFGESDWDHTYMFLFVQSHLN